jgi:hypothetical protein
MRFLAATLAAAALAGAAPALAAGPSLRLVTGTPLVLVGSGFRSAEHVTVTASGVRVLHWRVIAVRGAFRVSLGGLVLSRCNTVAIVAVGSAGSRVALRIPRPACMPAKNPA